MPGIPDSGIYVIERGLPWHVAAARQFGGPEVMDGIEQKVNAYEALVLAGADYDVDLFPVFIDANPDYQHPEERDTVEVPNAQAVVRLDTMAPMSVVGNTYVPFQNKAVAEFGQAVLDTGEPDIETAGIIQGGLKVFFSFELPKTIKVDGDDGDIRMYLLVMNGHDGQTPLIAVITPIRAVCTNTIRLAIQAAKSKFTIRHQGDMKGRVAQAKTALRIAYEYGDALGTLATRLINTPASNLDAKAVFDAVYPLPPDPTERQQDNRVSDKVFQVWHESPNLGNIRTTGWGLVNAIAEYQDWAYPYRGGKRVTSEERKLLNTLARGVDDPASRASELILARAA
jgi:phage/plasmid-like protein (TIGR03299 family)